MPRPDVDVPDGVEKVGERPAPKRNPDERSGLVTGLRLDI